MSGRIGCVLCAFLFLGLAPVPVLTASEPDHDALAAALRRVLQAEPQIVLDVLRAHQIEVFDIVSDGLDAKKAQAEDRRIAGEILNPLQPVLESDRAVLGPPGAPVTIVVYSDFLCHFCAEAAHTLGDLMTRSPGRIRLYAKHNPLSDLARETARYFEAFARQDPDRVWQFYAQAFLKQSEIQEQGAAALDALARAAGADMARLAADLKDPALEQRIEADIAEAERFGFDGTPAVVINGVALPGARSLEEYEQIIARTTPPPASPDNIEPETRNPSPK